MGITKLKTIEEMYQAWLKKMKLQEPLHPTQAIQLRQAFFGGCTSLMTMQHDELADLPEIVGAAQMQTWMDECRKYWKDEVDRHHERTRRN